MMLLYGHIFVFVYVPKEYEQMKMNLRMNYYQERMFCALSDSQTQVDRKFSSASYIATKQS